MIIPARLVQKCFETSILYIGEPQASLVQGLRSRSTLYNAELVFDPFVQLHGNFVLSGKLHVTSQQIFFPVNGPFLCSCLGLICLNLMRFTCSWMLQRKKIFNTALEFATAVEKNLNTALDQSTARYKKFPMQ